MSLFRSEEHVRRWPLHVEAADDYVLPVSKWAEFHSGSLWRNRLEPDYLSHLDEYLAEYRIALQATGKLVPAPDRVLTTVLFTDIVDSTKRAAIEGDHRWRALLERHDKAVTDEITHFAGQPIKQTGDGMLARFDSPARAVRCAAAIARAVHDIGLESRAGVHTGECELRGDDIAGIAVHIGARIAALASAGEVLVSRTVTEAVVGSGLAFESRGEHQLKGVPGEWEIHAVLL